MKRIILIVIGVVILFFVVKSLIPTEKGRFKKDIKALKNAIENENRTEVLKYIDTTYLDRANMTYEEFIGRIDYLFEQIDSMKILMSGMKVEIDSIDAQETVFANCSLGLKIIARQEGQRVLVFGGMIKPARVRAFFRKSNQYYKVYNAEY